MNILIVGSLREGADADKERFRSACREIGAELVRREHTLVVGSNNPTTADAHLLAGANSVEGMHRVIVIRGDDERTVPEQSQYPNLTFHYRRRGDTWAVARAFQIREADVVLAIGGGNGTLQTGMTAPALEKPVLGVRAFGGSGREIWKTCKSDYLRVGLAEGDGGILENDNWSAGSAMAITNALELLVRRNPYQTRLVPLLTTVLAIVLLLMSLWVIVFVRPELIFGGDSYSVGRAGPANTAVTSYSYAIFTLLALSAFLGAGMRTALPMLEGRIISLTQLLNEMTVGLFLAFGFVLIYLSTGVLVFGEVTLNAEKFHNAAVTTSLMGFTVAFFAERTAAQLREKLSKQL